MSGDCEPTRGEARASFALIPTRRGWLPAPVVPIRRYVADRRWKSSFEQILFYSRSSSFTHNQPFRRLPSAQFAAFSWKLKFRVQQVPRFEITSSRATSSDAVNCFGWRDRGVARFDFVERSAMERINRTCVKLTATVEEDQVWNLLQRVHDTLGRRDTRTRFISAIHYNERRVHAKRVYRLSRVSERR